MPETEHFTAFGLFNGFPYCPTKVNVADRGDGQPYDFWTTLGGWSKVSEPADEVKAASIRTSQDNAAKLFWSVDGYSAGECTSTFDFGDGEKTAEVSFPVGSADATSGSLSEPEDRACIENPASEEYQVEDESTDNVIAKVVCGAPKIVRMYNGDVLDEDNFVGYGVAGGGIAESTFYMSAGELEDVSVLLLNYMDEYIQSGEITDYAYTEMNGMHFVCETYYEQGGTAIADPLNRSISIDRGNSVTEIEIGSFEFYSYVDPTP